MAADRASAAGGDAGDRFSKQRQISIPRNVTDVIFELAAARAFDGARRDLHEEAQAFDRGDHVRINMGRDRQG